MSLIIYGLLALTGMSCAILGVARFLRFRNWHLTERMRLLDLGFRDAETLIDSDDTPEEVVDLLDFLVHNAKSPHVNRRLSWALLTGALRDDLGRPSQKSQAFQETIRAMQPELRKVFDRAVARFMLASTYNNPVIGFLLRRAALYAFETDPSSAEPIIVSMEWRQPRLAAAA